MNNYEEACKRIYGRTYEAWKWLYGHSYDHTGRRLYGHPYEEAGRHEYFHSYEEAQRRFYGLLWGGWKAFIWSQLRGCLEASVSSHL